MLPACEERLRPWRRTPERSPSSGEWRGGRSPQTKGVNKPPSNEADPPHRTRLEAAAMESSLDTFSTPAGTPMEHLPFVDVSGEWRVSDPPFNRHPILLPNVFRPGGPRVSFEEPPDNISSGPLAPLYRYSPVTRPAPSPAGVRRHGRFQHDQHRGAQGCYHPPLAWRGHRYFRPSTKPDREVPPAPPGHTPPSSRGLSSASIAPLPRSGVSAKCNYSHTRSLGTSPK